MPKSPRLPKARRPDGSQPLGAASDYEVGYGRPPERTRFKPGQSGNPKGRPPRQRNTRTVMEEALNQPITIREGDRTRSVPKREAIILSMVNSAIKGDAKAQASVFSLEKSLGMTEEPPESTTPEPFTPDDEAVIADYLRRHGSELQQTAATDREDATSVGTNASDRRAA